MAIDSGVFSSDFQENCLVLLLKVCCNDWYPVEWQFLQVQYKTKTNVLEFDDAVQYDRMVTTDRSDKRKSMQYSLHVSLSIGSQNVIIPLRSGNMKCSNCCWYRLSSRRFWPVGCTCRTPLQSLLIQTVTWTAAPTIITRATSCSTVRHSRSAERGHSRRILTTNFTNTLCLTDLHPG